MQTVGRLWTLLGALLQLPELPSSAAVNPALLAAAAQACQAVASADLQSGQALTELCALGSALLGCLQLLASRDRVDFAPSLEHRRAVHPFNTLICAACAAPSPRLHQSLMMCLTMTTVSPGG